MSKVRVISERKVIEKELDIEYPFYLYFQDEMTEEYHKVGEKFTIIVEINFFGGHIKVENTRMLEEHIIKNNLTKKEHFLEFWEEVLGELKKEVE